MCMFIIENLIRDFFFVLPSYLFNPPFIFVFSFFGFH